MYFIALFFVGNSAAALAADAMRAAATSVASSQDDLAPFSVSELLELRGRFVEVLIHSQSPHEGILFLLLCVGTACCFYGLIMGMPGGWRQALSSALKVPFLFLLSLAICFPLLYVSSKLLGSKLSGLQLLGLLLIPLSFASLLLAGFAPISAFFASTSDYHFMKLLHVAIFAISASVGMTILTRGLRSVTFPLDTPPGSLGTLLHLWIFIYAFVGMQMAWRLRPFIGAPDLAFEFFRDSPSHLNFYRAVLISLHGIALSRSARTTESQPVIRNTESPNA